MPTTRPKEIVWQLIKSLLL